MRKLVILAFALLCFLTLPSAYAQNSQFLNVVLGPTGRPLAGATATFCSNTAELAIPCTTTINLFDSTGASISNPQISDSRGNVNVWAPAGVYLLTVTGNGITPYRLVVNFPGGGGGGSGTVSGTVPHLAKFTAPTTVGDSTCTDDGTNPTRCSNGDNTASGGLWIERIVDSGGVTQGQLVCRSGIALTKTCPAGTTGGVLGVAGATVAPGGTVPICFAGTCHPVAFTATTTGDYLIPSATVAGQVDDTGSTTKPGTGIQSFLAESSVAPGSATVTTLLALDTINAASAGSGTINPCTINGVTYYVAGTTLGCITPPTANGNYVVNYNVTGGVSVAPTATLPGVVTRTVAGTTDTLLYSDRVGCVKYTSNSAVAVTLPQAGIAPFTNNYVFCAYVSGNGTVTITPGGTSNLTTYNGSSVVTGPLSLTKGQFVTIHSPDNANYDARFPGGTLSAYQTVLSNGTSVTQRTKLNLIQSGSAAVACVDNSGASQTDCTISGINGPPTPVVFVDGNFTYTSVNSDYSQRFVSNAPGAGPTTYTQPQAGTISVAPFVRQDVFEPAACTNCSAGTFIIGAGNIKTAYIAFNGNSTTVTNVTDTAGNTWSRVAADRYDSGTNFSGSMWKTLATTGSGADTLNVTMSGSTSIHISLLEYTTISFIDHADSASGTGANVTIPISYKTVVAVAAYANAGSGCPAGWTQRTSLGIGAWVTCERLYDSVASSSFNPIGVASGVVFNSDYAVTGNAAFLNGWNNVVENYYNSNPPPTVVYTPTTSKVNGQAYGTGPAVGTKLNIFPNEWCGFMSDGANYNGICGFIPNTNDDGVNGGNVTIQAHPNTAGTSSIGATTLYATPSSPVSNYLMGGYADVTVVGTSCASNTTVVLNAIYTDPNGAGATTRALGTFTIVNNGTAGDNFGFPMTPLRAKGSTNIQFSTTYTAGGSCSPAPTVQVTPILQVM